MFYDIKYVIENIKDLLKTYDNSTNFKFDPHHHKYTYDGVIFTSVTQFISNYHEKFNDGYWSKIKSDQRGVPQAEVLSEWKDKNDRANIIGHGTHQWIENYFNKIIQDIPCDLDIVDRINKFNIAYVKYLYKLTPVCFEQRIFSTKYKIAGTIDSIFLYNDSVIILDWKTNKDFKDSNHPKGQYNKLLYPFQEYYENHHTKYSIQTSLYSLILKEIGIDVKASYLLHIGPNEEAKMYRSMDLSKELEIALASRI